MDFEQNFELQNVDNFLVILREAFQTKKWGNFGLGSKSYTL